ncbi:hypothetical protein KL930_000047 [Ogataea haglerorum]|uniref:uncharacterized protein n=1 Tax=Ogataea haglerorum TaxID=1937702 RepID=UPI001C8A3962|nr:uncharacterized protein KL911_001087 [Ogataea haglerorum]KAG7697899.1 hypothetical protein KL951_002473 [Ogataea haglerorum]KAG7706719.1 hypothetical protein KL950_003384 [Ogataea haglerorum]KAG7742040.1 hypothetical protein KL923_001295 [Ogataea haglerorum]KAG7750679.1 hypothetical protein KL912_001239 [Ogataea haglerorum]KAG7758111.1 hypothetical protein KL911_001087 [Ogataea haglerorum]
MHRRDSHFGHYIRYLKRHIYSTQQCIEVSDVQSREMWARLPGSVCRGPRLVIMGGWQQEPRWGPKLATEAASKSAPNWV